MDGTVTIILGGQPFEVPPLNLGQIEALSIAVVLPDTTDPQENERRTFRRSIEAIAAALSEKYPAMTPEAMRKGRITATELIRAYSAVLRHSGLVPTGEATAPAASEAPAPGSTGPTSTDASPPA